VYSHIPMHPHRDSQQQHQQHHRQQQQHRPRSKKARALHNRDRRVVAVIVGSAVIASVFRCLDLDLDLDLDPDCDLDLHRRPPVTIVGRVGRNTPTSPCLPHDPSVEVGSKTQIVHVGVGVGVVGGVADFDFGDYGDTGGVGADGADVVVDGDGNTVDAFGGNDLVVVVVVVVVVRSS